MAKRKRKYKRKTWWQKHYDEVILVSGLVIGGYYFLRAVGVL